MTVQIDFAPSVEASLSAAANAHGMSVEDYVRQCVEQKLKSIQSGATSAPVGDSRTAYELGKHVFGKHSSGRSDLSEKHEEILGEIFDEKHRNR